MPLQSDGDLFRDPYRLDHLAEELVNRDSAYLVQATILDDANEPPELPEHEPLSHADKFLSAKVFSIEEFLLARSHIPLPDLRAELRQYHAELKEELVKLINDDYEAFISLSTDLHDEGARLGRLRHPLASLKVEVLESKSDLQALQDTIHSKLIKRSKLREEKSLLHLLLKISESVTRLESLLSITSPDQVAKEQVEIRDMKFTIYSPHPEDSSDERFRGNRAKHLGRVGVEYTQLLYHVRKAQAENCSFITEIQWRVDRVHSTLCSDLDQLFAQTINCLKAENRGTELERNKWTADLTECLRTYDTLGLWRDAEDVIRRELIRAFVKKEIHSGALISPHSPIVPRTPIPNTVHPFTAFIPKQAQYQSSLSNSGLAQAQLLDNTENPLAGIYNQILRFIERDVCRIMNIAEKVGVKQTSGVQKEQDKGSIGVNGESIYSAHFEIMANVVWDEFGKSIMDELGGVVFSVGRPKEFRKNYETTQAFIHSLEILAPSMEAVDAMRRHPTYLDFERRWQLPVYFQMRWKEITGTLEEGLISTRLESIAPRDGNFFTPQASATWIALSACWSSEIYIPELSYRFWKLTLQVPSSHGTSRVPGPGTAIETSSVEFAAADDTSLRQYTAVMADIASIEANTFNIWDQVIKVVISDVDEGEGSHMEVALRESISCLTSFLIPLSGQIVAILTKRCCDALLPVRSIPSQFRAMSNKRMPSEPSYFVSSVLRPVKQFFAIGVAEGIGSPLRAGFSKSFSTEVRLDAGTFPVLTCHRYIGYLTTMKKTEESLKRLKNKKPTYSIFGNSSPANDVRDEERIRCQMILDVEAFGKDALTLDIDVSTNSNFIALKEMVYASESD
ncbi:oligomeric golgi complex component, COG2-domain-containing protein [Gymnopilus junonius]|uniref:Conserved oligomeric Golgi complex subunit 2 n=1 Tax=Gymnopilus junonius TaxID=109634 RepID=A0A9P5NTU5_GYMJU|nr:oligomeric golgi complex component, COG2-domain-containing protein [Gymnopilus junonius]